jgi:hypothetical protein
MPTNHQACVCHPIVDALVLSLVFFLHHFNSHANSCHLKCSSSSLTSPQQQQKMSAFSASPINPSLDSSNLEQLKVEAVALEGSKKHEEALMKYEEVLVIQQRDLPVGHPDTHETLISIDRVIDQLKYASIDNLEVANSAHSL